VLFVECGLQLSEIIDSLKLKQSFQ